MPEGDAKAYVEAKPHGLYPVLTDESLLRKVDDPPIGSGPLLLTNVTEYCRPAPECDAFEGTLPFGILASDPADLVRSKMNQPDSFNERLCLERWAVDRVWVFVKYDRAMASIDTLSPQVPDA